MSTTCLSKTFLAGKWGDANFRPDEGFFHAEIEEGLGKVCTNGGNDLCIEHPPYGVEVSVLVVAFGGKHFPREEKGMRKTLLNSGRECECMSVAAKAYPSNVGMIKGGHEFFSKPFVQGEEFIKHNNGIKVEGYINAMALEFLHGLDAFFDGGCSLFV